MNIGQFLSSIKYAEFPLCDEHPSSRQHALGVARIPLAIYVRCLYPITALAIIVPASPSRPTLSSYYISQRHKTGHFAVGTEYSPLALFHPSRGLESPVLCRPTDIAPFDPNHGNCEGVRKTRLRLLK